MLKHMINDVSVVTAAIIMLAALCATALYRSHEAHITEAVTPPCHTQHCHTMNPGHWL